MEKYYVGGSKVYKVYRVDNIEWRLGCGWVGGIDEAPKGADVRWSGLGLLNSFHQWEDLAAAKEASPTYVWGRGYTGGHNTASRLGWPVCYPGAPAKGTYSVFWDATVQGAFTGYQPGIAYLPLAGDGETCGLSFPSIPVAARWITAGWDGHPAIVQAARDELTALQGREVDSRLHNRVRDAAFVLARLAPDDDLLVPLRQEGKWWQIEAAAIGKHGGW